MNPDQPAYILDRMTMELKKYVQQMNVQFAALPYRPAAGPPPKAAPRSPPRPRLATPPDPPDGDGPAGDEGPRAPLGNRPTEIRPPLPPHSGSRQMEGCWAQQLVIVDGGSWPSGILRELWLLALARLFHRESPCRVARFGGRASHVVSGRVERQPERKEREVAARELFSRRR